MSAGTGLAQLFEHDFIRHALLAGTPIAAAAGLIGWFLVQRGQVFAGDALGHVAYTGALAALALGIDPRLGLFASTVVVGLLLSRLGRRGGVDDVVVGSVFAWVLGLGVFFLTLYTTRRSTGNGAASVNYLFGSIFGISAGHAALASEIATAVCVVLVAIARPLLFAGLDPAVAAARGVAVRGLGLVLMLLLGVVTAEATQVVGALLVLGLLAAPAGAAVRLSTRPFTGMALAAAIAIAALWVGLLVSYLVPDLPPSFAIVAVAGLTYLTVALVQALNQARPRTDRDGGRMPRTVDTMSST